jgi:hypothetical protein
MTPGFAGGCLPGYEPDPLTGMCCKADGPSCVEEQLCALRSCPDGMDFCTCQCLYSPVLLDLEGDGVRLTGAAGGVPFDLDGDGRPERLSWTRAGADDAWLALDRDGDGRVTSGRELFGNFTAQPPSTAPNGFSALAEFDAPARGGNSDGVIDAKDAAYASLRLWRDADHDGLSRPEELRALAESGVAAISLDYRRTRRRDAHGNQFRYWAKVEGDGAERLGPKAWDVFLVKED